MLNCPVDSLVFRVAKAGHLDSSLVDKFGGLLASDSDGDDHDDNADDNDHNKQPHHGPHDYHSPWHC